MIFGQRPSNAEFSVYNVGTRHLLEDVQNLLENPYATIVRLDIERVRYAMKSFPGIVSHEEFKVKLSMLVPRANAIHELLDKAIVLYKSERDDKLHESARKMAEAISRSLSAKHALIDLADLQAQAARLIEILKSIGGEVKEENQLAEIVRDELRKAGIEKISDEEIKPLQDVLCRYQWR